MPCCLQECCSAYIEMNVHIDIFQDNDAIISMMDIGTYKRQPLSFTKELIYAESPLFTNIPYELISVSSYVLKFVGKYKEIIRQISDLEDELILIDFPDDSADGLTRYMFVSIDRLEFLSALEMSYDEHISIFGYEVC